MINNKDIAKEICQKLGGFFGRDNVLVGGSLGLELNYPRFSQFPDSDIDIFILKKRIESWALLHIMNVFDDVILYDRNIDKMPNYKIKGQWRRLTGMFCPKNELDTVKIDFIFVDADIESLVKDTACDLSKLYSRLDYENFFRVVDHKELSYIHNRLSNNQCYMNIKQATLKHIEKYKERCKELGLQRITDNFYF